MSITEKELEHLATLSKLKLTTEEKEKFLWNMDSIINFLNELKVSNITNYNEWKKLECFNEWAFFENSKKLLENSTHQKWSLIWVKTSFTK
jgi:aspartyl/glutamyl-tRNA(Asn/Gln) amidotransferase C subunit